jgi:hypothetical protein
MLPWRSCLRCLKCEAAHGHEHLEVSEEPHTVASFVPIEQRLLDLRVSERTNETAHLHHLPMAVEALRGDDGLQAG